MKALDDSVLMVNAYVDGELDVAQSLEAERQLAADPALSSERASIEALRSAIREHLPRETTPIGLVHRIETAIGTRIAKPNWQIPANPSWRMLAASVALAAFISSGSTWLLRSAGPADTVADIIVHNHIRSLMAPQPVDVASSDRHTVKPWFLGRVSEAPRVGDLASEGFPLIGGRIDVLHRVPIATLVYKRREHLISLSAVPLRAVPDVATAPAAVAGYNILSWTENGTLYWAISDVAKSDLEAFVRDFRSTTF
jgi:anti-sigma factor RsiW